MAIFAHSFFYRPDPLCERMTMVAFICGTAMEWMFSGGHTTIMTADAGSSDLVMVNVYC
ncbi:MAG: hypothetical protein OEX19_00935 [Gammaproteobacteria bacterium]|nr:hypothetical protein [Gammaproteobacteria bacterium]